MFLFSYASSSSSHFAHFVFASLLSLIFMHLVAFTLDAHRSCHCCCHPFSFLPFFVVLPLGLSRRLYVLLLLICYLAFCHCAWLLYTLLIVT